MARQLSIAASLLMVLVVSMCTTPDGGASIEDTLLVTIDSPSEVFRGQEFTVNLEIENRGNVTFENVDMSFFKTGSFEKLSSCSLGPFRIEPGKLQVMTCRLVCLEDIGSGATETIEARIKYQKTFSASIDFPMFSLSEYEKRKRLGTFKSLDEKFIRSNSELYLEAEISENPVIRNSQEKFVHFTLRNVGSGLIESIAGDDINITSIPQDVVEKNECNLSRILFQDRGNFTKITCPVSTQNSQEDYVNAFVFFRVKYPLEERIPREITIIS